jgi:hypothetical protein
MFCWLQDQPRFLEIPYDFAYRALAPFRRWLRPNGIVEKTFIVLQNTSAWINDFTGVALKPPPRWVGVEEIMIYSDQETL